MEVMDFNNTIWNLLRDISVNMDSIFRPMYDKHGLTAMQARILTDVREQEQTIGNLGKNLCVAGANISAMCRKLEKEGFLNRVRDKMDERVVKVHLSEKGESAILDIEALLTRKFDACLKTESTENINDIIEGLQKLNVLLQKINNSDMSL
ncbi:DNA-binding MarR family transcriptional regulator [Clostridium pascui]|uniref:MarR family winged helix-turn-helix transcriptional regulator n=1 Tax=Clostridium pascui TaxID=46609 RepID=UPI00195C1DCA|nr:MarR family transcriptional regulator [Clostridium pascui]MBM7871351.1 DNA-binding MarR family transcriptional regulator [Clostridium pascui]